MAWVFISVIKLSNCNVGTDKLPGNTLIHYILGFFSQLLSLHFPAPDAVTAVFPVLGTLSRTTAHSPKNLQVTVHVSAVYLKPLCTKILCSSKDSKCESQYFGQGQLVTQAGAES